MSDDSAKPDPALQESTHEWTVRAERYAPLIDGEEYFRAVRSSIVAARHQIIMIGWEIHSEVALLRGRSADEATERDGFPVVLADLLRRVVEQRDELHIYMLIWSGSALFAMEREHFPRMKRPWEQHPRIRLEWATDTPSLASHHQKFVVLDDRVAYAGGMDLTKARWDAHAHQIDDRRRGKPGLFPSYSNPYHDTMAVFDGAAAKTLGEHARTRWEQATSERLEPPEDASGENGPSLWPAETAPLLKRRDVHISLTQPQYRDRTEKRQVEGSLLQHIRAARDLIYIETQYLTAAHIVDELAGRLKASDGPQVVIVIPYGCPGLLQSMALDHERDRLLRVLRDADSGGRLGIYWPTLEAGDDDRPFETSVYVHAKVMIIDDRILRIGSANLNNRSMGLDTELDTWIEISDDDDSGRDAVKSFRQRSLSYLLGCEAGELDRAERDRESFVGAIESLRVGEATLHPFEHEAPEYSKSAPLDIRLADPGHPLDDDDVERVLRAMADEAGILDGLRRAKATAIGFARRHKPLFIFLAALVLVGVLILLSPLGDTVASIDVESFLRDTRESPFGLVGVLSAFVVLGSVGMPITALIVAAGVIIDSWWSAPFAILGVLLASMPGFAFGRLAPDAVTRPLTEGKIGDATAAFRDHAVLGVAAVRNLPIAPFAVMNTALGVCGITGRAYLLGTAIGMLPGVVMLSLFGQGLLDLVTEPTPGSLSTLAGFAALVVVISIVMQRLLRKFAPKSERGRES